MQHVEADQKPEIRQKNAKARRPLIGIQKNRSIKIRPGGGGPEGGVIAVEAEKHLFDMSCRVSVAKKIVHLLCGGAVKGEIVAPLRLPHPAFVAGAESQMASRASQKDRLGF